MRTVPDPAWLPVEVFRTDDSTLAVAAESALDEAGIAFVTKKVFGSEAEAPFAVTQPQAARKYVFVVAGESAREARQAIRRLPLPFKNR